MSSPIYGGYPIYVPPSDYTTGANAASSAADNITSNDDQLSINEFFGTSSAATLDLAHSLHGLAASDRELFSHYLRDMLGQMDSLFTMYNDLMTSWVSFSTINTIQADAGITAINNEATAANPSITTAQTSANNLNTATDTYNAEADSFNAQYDAGFANNVARDAAITQYNLAVDNYNNSATAYNNDANAANVYIQNYNDEIDNYNSTTLVQTNADIDSENITRAGQGLPPLPHQPPLAHADLLVIVPLQSHLPYADPTGHVPTATKVSTPAVIIEYPLPSTLQFTENFLDPSYTPFAANTFFYAAALKRLFRLINKDAGQVPITLQSIVRPESIIDRREADSAATLGAGGIGSSGLAMGLDHPALARVFSDSLVSQYFNGFNIATTNQVRQTLFAFTIATLTQGALMGALPGVNAYIQQGDAITNGSRIANSIGTIDAVLGTLRDDALKQPIDTVVNSATQLKDLKEDDRAKLSSGLQAAVSTALLKLSLGSLIEESKTPGLVKVVDGALIQASPENANDRFTPVKTGLEDLSNTYGSASVAELLGQYLNGLLGSNKDITRPQSPLIAKAVADRISSPSAPDSYSALNEIVKEEINKVLGPNANPAVLDEIARTLSNGASQFSLAGSARKELLGNTISQVGPTSAEHLTDQAIISLFGFSPNFNQNSIIERPKESGGSDSLLNSLTDSARELYSNDNKKFIEIVDRSFETTQEDFTSLGAFLREVIDPGQTLVGLMYEGRKGSAFERGSTDIKLG